MDDDLGAEKLSKLTCNTRNNEISNSHTRIISESSKKILEEISVQNLDNCCCSTTISSVNCVSNNNSVGNNLCNLRIEDDSCDEKEKTDGTPENIKKLDDTLETGKENQNNDEGDPLSKYALAFTIDFGKNNKSEATAIKYKTMVEKFQNRHKRGASLSKLEDNNSTIQLLTDKTLKKSLIQVEKQSKNKPDNKINLRAKEKNNSCIRDIDKRHSWSPRASTNEQFDIHKNTDNLIKFENNSIKLQRTNLKFDNINNNNFKPRSKVMQIALNKIDYVCEEPLIDDFISENACNNDYESISETGTYTVDGDNYTEEQKEQMNIDKQIEKSLHKSTLYKNYKADHTNNIDSKKNNILNINNCESMQSKPKISYLEKIKSRVKNITKSPEKKITLKSDIGAFTSVTTSGILSKKLTLDSNPKLNRKNSLTKSQIDNSEYISDISIKSFTDHEKAEYKMNLLPNKIDFDTINSYNHSNYNHNNSKINKLSAISNTSLKTAQTKSDWIQEWAKNARERSSSAQPLKQMTRSFDFERSITDICDSNDYRIKAFDRCRDQNINLKEYCTQSCNNIKNNNNNDNKPPISPSRIPSPMHTIGRARSSSTTRTNLIDTISSTRDTELYLQKTADAISNLAQSLSRKNSYADIGINKQSKKHLKQNQQHYSADEFSPTNNCRNKYQNHKRNLSFDYHHNNLMSQSLNNDTLGCVIDYRNNFETHLNYDKKTLNNNIDQTNSNKLQILSPIRRSKSFSIKPMTVLKAYSNNKCISNDKYQQVNVKSKPNTQLQKSASSASFKKNYNNYDNSIDYYINDENDLLNDYYSSDEIDETTNYRNNTDENLLQHHETDSEPITNTRYNKALLMRIEKSRQKVLGTSNQIHNKSSNNVNKIGAIACPNTPELPRRQQHDNNIHALSLRSSIRQSLPRDSSLSRLRADLPNCLASAKKQIFQTATNSSITNKKIQPKYMDISKYKTNASVNFLRKDDTKITLRNDMRKSTTTNTLSSRNDPTRTSNRSIKSSSIRSNSGCNMSNNGNLKRDLSVPKQKEAELAMWRRRATYDPMKSAAEGRKKQEAKKYAKTKETDNSSILRSKSFHNVDETLSTQNDSNSQKLEGDESYIWTLTSNESSDSESEQIDINI